MLREESARVMERLEPVVQLAVATEVAPMVNIDDGTGPKLSVLP